MRNKRTHYLRCIYLKKKGSGKNGEKELQCSTEFTELTPEIVHEYIEKIEVHAPRYVDGKRVQLLDIYFSGVGIVEPMTPEEMEEAFQKRLKAEQTKTA